MGLIGCKLTSIFLRPNNEASPHSMIECGWNQCTGVAILRPRMRDINIENSWQWVTAIKVGNSRRCTYLEASDEPRKHLKPAMNQENT